LATSLGDSCRYLLVDGIEHRQLINPKGRGWSTTVLELERIFG
jgi:hypothetical protein